MLKGLRDPSEKVLAWLLLTPAFFADRADRHLPGRQADLQQLFLTCG